MASERPSRPSRTNSAVTKTVGKGSKQSRLKSDVSTNSAIKADVEVPTPTAADGYPLVMIEMAASELIPTGDFANITIGPARARAWIDPRDSEPFSKDELANIAKATNQLAELVEVDVIAVQRDIALETMQSQASED